jgi:hypothetical protein
MDEPERLPCPSCGEPAALGARMCPHCGTDLLVEVVLRAPITDSRVRYKVARALQALAGAPPLAEIQNGLVAAREPLADPDERRAHCRAHHRRPQGDGTDARVRRHGSLGAV